MPVKEIVLEPSVDVGAKTVTKSRTRKTKSAKTGVKASKADKKVTPVANVPTQVVLPQIPKLYWISFYSGLILVCSLLWGFIFSNVGLSGFGKPGIFEYVCAILAPGTSSLVAVLNGVAMKFPIPPLFVLLAIANVLISIWIAIQVYSDEAPEHPVAAVASLWAIFNLFLLILVIIVSASQNSGKKRRR